MLVVLLDENLEKKGVEELHKLFSIFKTAAVEGDGSRSKTGDFSLIFLYYFTFFSIF